MQAVSGVGICGFEVFAEGVGPGCGAGVDKKVMAQLRGETNSTACSGL